MPGKTYRQLGVRLWGDGAYEREPIDGADTRYPSLGEARAQDVVVNKIWARNGSVAVVPPHLSGSFVSAEFPLFVVDRSKAEPAWLAWLAKWPEFWRRCDLAARGTSGKNRIRPEQFLDVRVPLPSLPEQRRRIARTEALASRALAVEQLIAGNAQVLARLVDQVVAAALEERNGQMITLGDCLAEPPRNGIAEAPSGEGETPILRISAATSRSDDEVDLSDIRWLAGGPERYVDWRLRADDLLACRFNGNRAFVGHFARVAAQPPEPLVYPDKLIRFRVDPLRAIPEFVAIALNHGATRQSVEALCNTTAGNIGISARRLAGVMLSLPSLEDQRILLSAVNAVRQRVREAVSTERETLQTLPKLRQAAIREMFS